MRISPLCVWASKLNEDEIMLAVREETKLTHSNATAINVSIVYACLIIQLLNSKGDRCKAYEACKRMAKRLDDKDILTWIDEEEKGQEPIKNKNIGWVKIAFYYTLHYLKKNISYRDAIIEVLLIGGDTDTNCCIVGGMLGAVHGKSGIPSEITNKVLKYDCSNEDPKKKKKDGKYGIYRPEFLSTKLKLAEMIENIIRIRPSELKVEDDRSIYLRAYLKIKNFIKAQSNVPNKPKDPKADKDKSTNQSPRIQAESPDITKPQENEKLQAGNLDTFKLEEGEELEADNLRYI